MELQDSPELQGFRDFSTAFGGPFGVRPLRRCDDTGLRRFRFGTAGGTAGSMVKWVANIW